MPTTCDFCNNTHTFGSVFCSRFSSFEPKTGNSAYLKTARQADSQEHTAGLSLFSVENGLVDFRVEGRKYVLSPGAVLLLNKGQRYQVSWKSASEAELLCVGFDEQLAGKVLQTVAGIPAPEAQAAVKFPVQFFNQADSLSPAVQQLLTRLREHLSRTSSAIDPAALFSGVFEQLFLMQRQVQATIDTLGPVKPSTRTELYNRLRMARTFIDCNLHRNMTLDEVASEACLSKFHFMRLFKLAFGQTVHQYITAQRLARTHLLLELEERPFADICRSMGYEDVAWFAKVYKRTYGLPPSRKPVLPELMLTEPVSKRAVA